MKASYFAILLLAGTCAAQQAKPHVEKHLNVSVNGTPVPVSPSQAKAISSAVDKTVAAVTAPVAAPQLTSTYKIALSSIGEKMKTNQDEARVLQEAFGEVNQDFMKEHPGWHLDGNGNPQKDATPAK